MILLHALNAVLSAVIWLIETLVETMAVPLLWVALGSAALLVVWRLVARRAVPRDTRPS
jgi:hypothetical protein